MCRQYGTVAQVVSSRWTENPEMMVRLHPVPLFINKSCEIIINLITKIMVKVLNSRELMSRDFKSIPDAVILAFNTLIVKNWNGLASAFKQSDVIAYIASDNITEEEAIKNHWLDVEPIYRANGFGVKYVGRGSDAEFTFWKA